MDIILASASPRRQELLKKLGFGFNVLPDNSPEQDIDNESPWDKALRLSRQKALNVAALCKNSIVIGADTLVAIDNKILGKPNDKAQAKEMLLSLSGRINTVYTGVTVCDTTGNKVVSDVVKTDVYFKGLSESEIDAYIKTKEPLDKAGAYGIQEIGALFIEKIDGDYFNVVGLPVKRLYEILKTDFKVDMII